MDKNKQLLYCLLGSVMLALLNNNIFEYSRGGIFPGGYGSSRFGELVISATNILSFIGFILIAVFSIILIIRNVNLED